MIIGILLLVVGGGGEVKNKENSVENEKENEKKFFKMLVPTPRRDQTFVQHFFL